jgi:hypothetical protein
VTTAAAVPGTEATVLVAFSVAVVDNDVVDDDGSSGVITVEGKDTADPDADVVAAVAAIDDADPMAVTDPTRYNPRNASCCSFSS